MYYVSMRARPDQNLDLSGPAAVLDFVLRITFPMSPHTSMGGSRVQQQHHQPRGGHHHHHRNSLLEGFLKEDHNQQLRRQVNLEEKLRSDLADRASRKQLSVNHAAATNYQD